MPPRLPPGPPAGFFGLGLANRFRREPLTFLPELARRYGDLVSFRMGPFRTCFAFHPELIRAVVVTHSRSFRRWEWQSAVLRQWDGNGLVVSEGDFWRRQRRLMQPAFHARRFTTYGAAMVDAASRLRDRWLAQPGRPVPIVPAMTGLTLEIIAKTLFDVDVAAQVAALGAAVSDLSVTAMKEMGSPLRLPDWLPLPGVRRKRRAIRLLDETIRGIIRARRAAGADRGDLLSMLLLAVDAEGDGAAMTDEQARDEAMVLFLAGHDTTAAALAWIACLLAGHGDVQERVAAEVRQVLGGRLPTAADLPQLVFTEAVVKETLRLYPPAWIWFAREAVTAVELGEYTIPAGGLVYVTPWVTQRDARWFADPERFAPERFLPENAGQIPPYAWCPFGGGPRSCIGSGFAMTEMVLVVATMLQRLRLALPAGQGPVALAPLMSLRPADEVALVPTVRPGA